METQGLKTMGLSLRQDFRGLQFACHKEKPKKNVLQVNSLENRLSGITAEGKNGNKAVRKKLELLEKNKWNFEHWVGGRV